MQCVRIRHCWRESDNPDRHVIILSDIIAYAERNKTRGHFMATISHEFKFGCGIQMSTMLLRNVKVTAEQEGVFVKISVTDKGLALLPVTRKDI